MNHRDYIFLTKLNNELKVGIDFLNKVSLDEFLNDEKLKRAACMTAINVGELVKGLTDQTTKKYCEIPWKQIAGFRDIAAHKYETLKMGDVYDVVKQDYSNLSAQITKILDNEIDEKK